MSMCRAPMSSWSRNARRTGMRMVMTIATPERIAPATK